MQKATGGPDRKAFRGKNIIPVNFLKDDPFWDVPPKLNNIDENCKSGEIKDLMIIERTEDSVRYYWRGNSPMTTGLGMLEYAKEQLLSDSIER